MFLVSLRTETEAAFLLPRSCLFLPFCLFDFFFLVSLFGASSTNYLARVAPQWEKSGRGVITNGWRVPLGFSTEELKPVFVLGSDHSNSDLLSFTPDS